MTFSLQQGGVDDHVKSDNTLTIHIHRLAHILDTCSLIFSSCPLFTVYHNRIMERHPTPLQVITTRAREGGPKKNRAKQKGRVKLIQLHMHQGCRAASTTILLLPKATFTTSIRLTSVYLFPASAYFRHQHAF